MANTRRSAPESRAALSAVEGAAAIRRCASFLTLASHAASPGLATITSATAVARSR
jgi:hypothetical protein